MRVYAISWSDEPPKYYLANSLQEAVTYDFCAWKDELTEEDATRETVRDEYEADLSSVALICELEN